ncbi:MAG: hypothetical protein IKO33_06940, partial [Bacteroidaceae bacterium]|nr:hypothetical protein [Bacteroidaceae bacterium]
MPMSYITTHIARYYYVSGTDGNAAVYVSDPGYQEKAYCIDSDHLGSITALYDQYGTKCFSASYDVWGKRTVGIDNVGFDRGFTGHEHIDEIGLINMNGRMYEPNLGRFISVDPYVQEPANSQNYNRYSYCLNNPLKYTDPTGEYWLIDDLIAAGIGGVVNVISNAFQGNINGFGDFFAAFGAGAIGGVGALYPEFGGWVWGGAAVGATNAWLGGATGDDIWKGAVIGALSGVAGGAAGQWGGQYLGNLVINGFNVASPVVKGAITGAFGGAVGGYAGGFTAGYLMTNDLDAANKAGLEGLWSGAAVGGVIGSGSGYRYAINNDLNPWTGIQKSLIQPLQTNNQISIDTPELIETLDLNETLNRIDNGIKLPFKHDGYIFENRENILPSKP